MPEYIEREALYKEVTEKYHDILLGMYPYNVIAYDMAQLIKTAPTADVVEVVRCKDCKNCDILYPRKEIGKEPEIAYYCETFRADKKPTDFCSYGKRKEGADNGNGCL